MSRTGAARAGLTLIEILVSILILSVVSIAMIGILMVSSELFRRGEFSRSANDEAIAVMGALDDDVKRIMPVVDGGWLYAAVSPLNDGNCVLGAAIPNPDPSGITSKGENGRLVVAWFVDSGGNLVRLQRTLTTAAAPRPNGTMGGPGTVDEDALLSDVKNYLNAGTVTQASSSQMTIITSGCLHFSAWLSLDDPQQPQFRRPNSTTTGIDWEAPASDVLASGTEFETVPPVVTAGGVPPAGAPIATPMPAAMRIAVVLTGGGRFAPKGVLTGPITGSGAGALVPISGVAVLPTIPGSMLRIDPDPSGPAVTSGTEWIEYSNYSGGKATVVRRGARRTQPNAPHAKGDLVRVGVTYSLVRSLPR